MEKTMEAIAVVDSELVSQHIKATPYGLEITGKPSTEEWYDTFMKVSKYHGMSQFYLGDLVVCAEVEWEGTYQDLIDLTGYDYGTLRNYASIARRFTQQFREDICHASVTKELPPFTSFQEVQSLDDNRAKYFLTMVTNGKWSKAKLREEVKRYKNGGNLPEPKEKTTEEIPDGWEAVKAGRYVPAPHNITDDTEPRCLVQLYKSEIETLINYIDETDDDGFLSLIDRLRMALEGI